MQTLVAAPIVIVISYSGFSHCAYENTLWKKKLKMEMDCFQEEVVFLQKWLNSFKRREAIAIQQINEMVSLNGSMHSVHLNQGEKFIWSYLNTATRKKSRQQHVLNVDSNLQYQCSVHTLQPKKSVKKISVYFWKPKHWNSQEKVFLFFFSFFKSTANNLHCSFLPLVYDGVDKYFSGFYHLNSERNSYK